MATVDRVVVRVPCAAPASAAWELLGTPARRPEWSPQVRAVSGLDPVPRRSVPAPPALKVGIWVLVHGPWPVRLPARFTRLRSAHTVHPVEGGCEVVWDMRVEGPGGGLLTRSVLAAYGPLVRLALRRLARLAAGSVVR